ncbi:MAG: glycosyltransferase family 4 protein [Gammaproteobacteria bacterium]|nr:glycosyltransferase family 4 protein [Gammaproteobacteria bacterium]MBU1972414.1 glycosyltransferase family 4 protein [Gammaproteobacteria bacterium]
MSVLALPLLSALLSAITIFLMLRVGRVGPLDLPNQRSLHTVAVPRSGGIGILAGVIVGMAAEPPALTVLAGFILVALVSWWDDRRSLPVVARFASHFTAGGLALGGGLAAQWAEWGLWGQVAALLGIVWMTNLYNFMDGANGLAGGMAVFGFGAYAVAAGTAGQVPLAAWASCIAAAAGGFLLFNFDPARIFMGDIGSVSLGFLAAILGLEGMRLEVWPIWFPLLVFAPFVVDASVTLAKRALRGDKVWQAHREHYYQRLVRSGWSHRKLALHEYGLMAAVSVSACAMLTWPAGAQGAGLLAWVVLLGGLMLRIDTLVMEK